MSAIRSYLDESYLPDTTIINEVNSFPIRDFQSALIRCLHNKIEGDWWNAVIYNASRSKIHGISKDQRPHLGNWIKLNWYWLTEGWSKRDMISLSHRISELVGPPLN